MNLVPTMVTNKNQVAPKDLVVLFISPQEINEKQREDILELDWYQVDGNFDPQVRLIFVSWTKLNRIFRHNPQAPADYGHDPLETVKYIDKEHRKYNEQSFYSNCE